MADQPEAPEQEPTVKTLIDQALGQLTKLREDLKAPDESGSAREFSLAITALEDAKMRATRGLAKRGGVFAENDLQTPAGLEAAGARHASSPRSVVAGVTRS